MKKTFTNPILPGFYPDPTICRVGEDYYLVTSSFELFPALPVFHSRDLVHWTQLGHALDRPDWLYIDANLFSGGMMAPTLRYHDGTFYLICCNFADSGNFLLTAKDPAGPWSRPLPLPEVPGIDASVFFDDDGTCYVTSTGRFDFPDGTSQGIWGAVLDVETGKLLTEPKPLWESALRGAPSPEAPHLYHIGGWYYLLTAEGGTEVNHSVVIARSRTPLGDYEGNPANPIMTHRHMGKRCPVGNPGHADLVETQNGDWYAVLLASRLVGGFHKNMGRETFLLPVQWEDEWPLFSPETGRVELSYPCPNLPEQAEPAPEPVRDDFSGDTLANCWVFWGTPYQDFWKLEDGCLKLKALLRPLSRPLKKIDMSVPPVKVYDDNVSCVFRRQRHSGFTARCQLRFAPTGQACAGLLLLQQCNHQIRVEKWADRVRVVLAECGMDCPPFLPFFQDSTTETVLAELPCAEETVCLGVSVNGQDIQVLVNDVPLCRADGRRLNPECLGPMTGTMVGMFATANGAETEQWAAFDWFDYKENV